MTDERFWALIDEARVGTRASARPKQLKKVLDRVDDREALEFGHKFCENLCDLNHWDLWAAGYVIAGGMGDDSFHYFRSWIIGKGKTAFELAMQNPDELAPILDDDEVDNEALEYVSEPTVSQMTTRAGNPSTRRPWPTVFRRYGSGQRGTFNVR